MSVTDMPSLRSQISRRFGRCWADAAVKPHIQAMTISTLVMPGLSASKTRVNALMLPGIHVFLFAGAMKSWMAGTSPAMTEERWVRNRRVMCLLVHAAVGHQGALELGALEVGTGQDGAGQPRLGEVGVLEVGAGEIGAIEIGVGEIGAFEIGLAQHGIEQA